MFKKAKSLQGVVLSIEHRSLNDTIGSKTFADYQKMKHDTLKKLHPKMKRADSNVNDIGFLNSFVLHPQPASSARSRRNTTAKSQAKNIAPEVDMFEGTEYSDNDPLRDIFDAETCLLIDLVTN